MHSTTAPRHHVRHARVAGRQIDMLNGPLLGKILLFALPLGASSLLQQLFNLADVAVVGRFTGAQALAAVGSNGPVINLLVNLFTGLSVGANVVVAGAIGRREEDALPRMVHTVIAMALLGGLFLLALGQAAARPILVLMGTPQDVLPLAVQYLHIYFLGAPFFMLYNFGAAVLRSKGDTQRPLYSLFLAGVINVLLNLLLVIVFHLGVAGVAIATVISNVVSSGLVAYFLTQEQGPLRLSLRRLTLDLGTVRQVVAIGAPAGVQGMVFSLSNVVIQSSVNSFGSYAMAGSSAANNFESLTFIAVNAFTQAAVTFTSQNHAAGRYSRCRRILALTLGLGLATAAAMDVVFLLGRGVLIQVYTTDAAVLPYAMTRMTVVLPFQVLMVLYEVSAGSLRGMGHSLLPAVLTVLGSCAFRLLWVYTVFRRLGTFAVLVAVYPVSWLVTAVVMLGAWWLAARRMPAQDAAA